MLTAAITLTRQRLECAAGDAEVGALRVAFDQGHLLRLPGFFSQDLLSRFDARLADAAFSPRIEDGVEIEHTLDDPTLNAMLLVAMNDPALFAVIDRIAGCGPIGSFTGRVHERRAATQGHYYPWHTDAAHNRLVGISVNLGRQPHQGGVLQLRRADTRRLIGEMTNTIAGDAVLFRISEALEHHVTPIRGPVSRLVLAGWFRRTPAFWASALSGARSESAPTARTK